jgi:hypothetical protein
VGAACLGARRSVLNRYGASKSWLGKGMTVAQARQGVCDIIHINGFFFDMSITPASVFREVFSVYFMWRAPGACCTISYMSHIFYGIHHGEWIWRASGATVGPIGVIRGALTWLS